ncbi:lipopolysaccharide kinase InaA family protein [Halopseudomonas bauzanensis]|uniref:Lipopolysaccharide kinase (Kdo/WaaP) family protein n=1 Tax=Halopseudomonas bauzanensis TaxID=653930 RepID=A0A1I4PID1_9GAMM|nr:lipopolysaccharide kinase InaA family protein [Halopseudomonas bauzanensis]SES23390.1 Lipopolysaccharide kinase (Kdo/WaaP) family protein [Halopseudomonas bauzanensis]SFM27350.1 Lipopolysaccharide kinase (Kdo/WaaP) family protein [Halopseudomonas bauzanensis]
MNTSPFIAVNVSDTLRRHQLDSFNALWEVAAELVDEPNHGRGGISSVSRLTLEDANGRPKVFYLKRQSNYQIRNLRRPFGEPTASREFYNIGRFAERGIPALEAAFYGQRKVEGELQAILLTREVKGYLPLDDWFSRWDQLSFRLQRDLITAAASLVATLREQGVVHNCLYPKHLFLRPTEDGVGARFIDLEKSRAHLFSPWGNMRDLDALNRRSRAPSRTQRLRFLLTYLGKSRVDAEVRYWARRVTRRTAKKSKRRK